MAAAGCPSRRQMKAASQPSRRVEGGSSITPGSELGVKQRPVFLRTEDKRLLQGNLKIRHC